MCVVAWRVSNLQSPRMYFWIRPLKLKAFGRLLAKGPSSWKLGCANTTSPMISIRIWDTLWGSGHTMLLHSYLVGGVYKQCQGIDGR